MARPMNCDTSLNWEEIIFPPTDSHIYFSNRPELKDWGAQNFGMDVDDIFGTLPKQFNTVSIPLLTQEAFCNDVYHVARTAKNKDDLYCQLKTRRDSRLEQLHGLWRKATDPDELLKRVNCWRSDRRERTNRQDLKLVTLINNIHCDKSLDTYITYFAWSLRAPRDTDILPRPAIPSGTAAAPTLSTVKEALPKSLASSSSAGDNLAEQECGSQLYLNPLSGEESSQYRAPDERCSPLDESGSTIKEEEWSGQSESPSSSRYTTPPQPTVASATSPPTEPFAASVLSSTPDTADLNYHEAGQNGRACLDPFRELKHKNGHYDPFGGFGKSFYFSVDAIQDEEPSKQSESPSSSRYATPPEYPSNSPVIRNGSSHPLEIIRARDLAEENRDKAVDSSSADKKARAGNPPPYRVQKRQSQRKQSSTRGVQQMLEKFGTKLTASLSPEPVQNREHSASPAPLPLQQQQQKSVPRKPEPLEAAFTGLRTVRGSKITKAGKKPRLRTHDASARLFSTASSLSLSSAPASVSAPSSNISTKSVRRSDRLEARKLKEAKGKAAAHMRPGSGIAE
ncbi:hypothetical protein BD289DRAFT_482793 [Coniella lustricola]|uniref:Uncharacterized protein n=1 Tax=Coniella lustricola TaxID=2025994 RepID=A0A2T3A7R4_9PEZI|nr:hypothetical protein BD289DRAFT_482793 [Coniella lustricola]